jgi:hypothetical protein
VDGEEWKCHCQHARLLRSGKGRHGEKRRGAREMDLFGLRLLIELLLDLSLESRGVSVWAGMCVNEVGCVRVPPAWLGSVGDRGV